MTIRRQRGAVQRPTIDTWQAHDALQTVQRAREHLANPKMVEAMKNHLQQMNSVLTGPDKPKPTRRIR